MLSPQYCGPSSQGSLVQSTPAGFLVDANTRGDGNTLHPGTDTSGLVLTSPSSAELSGKGEQTSKALWGQQRNTAKVNSQLFYLDLTEQLGAQQRPVPASAKANLLGTHKSRTCHISSGPFQGALIFGRPTLPGLED